MPMEESHQDDVIKASKTVQKQIAETERKIGGAALQAQNELLKTLEEMSREVMSCATAEVQRGVNLSKKLSASHSIPDAIAAYQEWLSEEMNARSEDARRFMANSQKFMTTSARTFSSGWSGAGMST
jgi:negative regulator of replication initiation